MSRIVRSKSLSNITPIIKAYPPKQPKEEPYQPMHPNLQNAFDASGAELVDEAKACAATDQMVNASISFVPSECQIKQLRKQAEEAEKQRAALVEARNSVFEKTNSYKDFIRGMQPLLSKVSFLDVEEGSDKWNEKNAKAEGKYRNPGLCPLSLNPDDTILARLARGDVAEPLKGYVWGSDKTLTVIDDRNMPLGGGSCGPNGILVDCQEKYGKNRINLFYPSDDWPNLLRDYLAFRDANVNTIFARYCKKLRDHNGSYKIDLRGVDNDQNKLRVDLRPHYSKACQLLCAVEAEVNKGEKTLGELGIGVISFCQTWLRNDTRKGPAEVGVAQFSVMSPPFQTRFFVADGTLLSAALASNGDITLDHYKSYVKISTHFGETMQKEYGTDNPADVEVGKTGQAFVHLDGLAAAIGLS